jgi:hypothetical protein
MDDQTLNLKDDFKRKQNPGPNPGLGPKIATAKRAAKAVKDKTINTDKQPMFEDAELMFRMFSPAKGVKRVKELEAKGISPPDMEKSDSFKEMISNLLRLNSRAMMNTDKKGIDRIANLENKKHFLSLLATVPEKHAKDLMTTATLEARLNAKAINPRSKDRGLFQVKKKFYTKSHQNKANQLLRKIGYNKKLTNHSQLTDPVKALAYELASGKEVSMPVFDKYKLHQQEKAGVKRQDIASLAPDSAFLGYHAPNKKPEALPNRQGMQSVSDVDDMLEAIISNVRGADRTKVKNLKAYLRSMFPKNRKSVSASDIDKNTFNLIKKAIKLYDKETAEHVKFAELAPKGKILEKAAQARARLRRKKR